MRLLGRVWEHAWDLFGHHDGRLPVDDKTLQMDIGVDPNGFRPLSFEQKKRPWPQRNLARLSAENSMSKRFSPIGSFCYGAGKLEEDRICGSKPHEADCNCNDCSCVESGRDVFVRCSDCGSVFQPFHQWHESASGKAACLPGKGIGHYPYKNRSSELSIAEVTQLRNEARLRNEVQPRPNLVPAPA